MLSYEGYLVTLAGKFSNKVVTGLVGKLKWSTPSLEINSYNNYQETH